MLLLSLQWTAATVYARYPCCLACTCPQARVLPCMRFAYVPAVHATFSCLCVNHPGRLPLSLPRLVLKGMLGAGGSFAGQSYARQGLLGAPRQTGCLRTHHRLFCRGCGQSPTATVARLPRAHPPSPHFSTASLNDDTIRSRCSHTRASPQDGLCPGNHALPCIARMMRAGTRPQARALQPPGACSMVAASTQA